MSVQRGTQGCCPWGWACLCLSPPCQDELEARSASPSPPRLVSCFPREGNLGKRGGKAPGGPGDMAGLGQQKQNTLPHTCLKGGCHLGAAPAPAEQEPPAQGHPPPDGFTQESCGQRSLGTILRTTGHGRWHRQEKTQRAGTVPARWTFLHTSTLPSSQLVSCQHCMAIKVINAGGARSPAPCMATRICRK